MTLAKQQEVTEYNNRIHTLEQKVKPLNIKNVNQSSISLQSNELLEENQKNILEKESSINKLKDEIHDLEYKVALLLASA